MDKQDSLRQLLNEIIAVEPALEQPLRALGNISVGSISDSAEVIVGNNNVLQVIKNYNNPLPDDLILRLIALLDAQGKSAAQDLPAWTRGKSPFPGLRAFDEADAPVFFGRVAETEQLLAHLSAPDSLALPPSNTGEAVFEGGVPVRGTEGAFLSQRIMPHSAQTVFSKQK